MTDYFSESWKDEGPLHEAKPKSRNRTRNSTLDFFDQDVPRTGRDLKLRETERMAKNNHGQVFIRPPSLPEESDDYDDVDDEIFGFGDSYVPTALESIKKDSGEKQNSGTRNDSRKSTPDRRSAISQLSGVSSITLSSNRNDNQKREDKKANDEPDIVTGEQRNGAESGDSFLKDLEETVNELSPKSQNNSHNSEIQRSPLKSTQNSRRSSVKSNRLAKSAQSPTVSDKEFDIDVPALNLHNEQLALETSLFDREHTNADVAVDDGKSKDNSVDSHKGNISRSQRTSRARSDSVTPTATVSKERVISKNSGRFENTEDKGDDTIDRQSNLDEHSAKENQSEQNSHQAFLDKMTQLMLNDKDADLGGKEEDDDYDDDFDDDDEEEELAISFPQDDNFSVNNSKRGSNFKDPSSAKNTLFLPPITPTRVANSGSQNKSNKVAPKPFGKPLQLPPLDANKNKQAKNQQYSAEKSTRGTNARTVLQQVTKEAPPKPHPTAKTLAKKEQRQSSNGNSADGRQMNNARTSRRTPARAPDESSRSQKTSAKQQTRAWQQNMATREQVERQQQKLEEELMKLAARRPGIPVQLIANAYYQDDAFHITLRGPSDVMPLEHLDRKSTYVLKDPSLESKLNVTFMGGIKEKPQKSFRRETPITYRSGIGKPQHPYLSTLARMTPGTHPRRMHSLPDRRVISNRATWGEFETKLSSAPQNRLVNSKGKQHFQPSKRRTGSQNILKWNSGK